MTKWPDDDTRNQGECLITRSTILKSGARVHNNNNNNITTTTAAATTNRVSIGGMEFFFFFLSTLRSPAPLCLSLTLILSIPHKTDRERLSFRFLPFGPFRYTFCVLLSLPCFHTLSFHPLLSSLSPPALPVLAR